jgi:hypothetical protein
MMVGLQEPPPLLDALLLLLLEALLLLEDEELPAPPPDPPLMPPSFMMSGHDGPGLHIASGPSQVQPSAQVPWRHAHVNPLPSSFALQPHGVPAWSSQPAGLLVMSIQLLAPPLPDDPLLVVLDELPLTVTLVETELELAEEAAELELADVLDVPPVPVAADVPDAPPTPDAADVPEVTLPLVVAAVLLPVVAAALLLACDEPLPEMPLVHPRQSSKPVPSSRHRWAPFAPPGHAHSICAPGVHVVPLGGVCCGPSWLQAAATTTNTRLVRVIGREYEARVTRGNGQGTSHFFGSCAWH